MVRLLSNFQGPLNSLQVIFGQLIGTLRPSGSGPDPENGLFHQIYLLPGFVGKWVVSYLLRKQEDEANKTLAAEFCFFPLGPRKRGQKVGLARGRPKFWNFNIF